MNRPVAIWLGVLVCVGVAYGAYRFTRQVGSQEQSTAPVAEQVPVYGYKLGHFELVDSQGKTFTPKQLQGRVWIASFFFTRCQSACIKLNNRIAQLLAQDLRDLPVVFVSISVDPQHDRPEVLQQYAQHYLRQYDIDPKRWIFLTSADGSVEPIRQVSQEQFRVAFAKVTHSDRLMVIDAQGRVQGSYMSAFDVDIARLKRKVKELLGKSSPSSEDSSPRTSTAEKASE